MHVKPRNPIANRFSLPGFNLLSVVNARMAFFPLRAVCSLLALLALCPLAALADDIPDQATIAAISKDWRCQWCPGDAQAPQATQVEAGVAYLSNDSYRYGDYSGVDSKGAYALLDINYRRIGEQGERVQVDAEDVGLDSRSLQVNMRNRSLSGGLEYYAFPHRQSDSSRTPYMGVEVQSLPAGWVYADPPSSMSSLKASLHSENLYQDRNKLQLSLQSKTQQGHGYRFQFQQQTKQGRKSTGVAVGDSFAAARSVIAAQPIDNVTRQGEVAAFYDMKSWRFQAAYAFSQFDNRYDSLRLDYAYSSAPTINYAQIGLEPDNQMQRVSLSARYQNNPDYRTDIAVALAQATQSQAFLPYSLNSNLYPSKHDLQGRIDFIDANIRQLMRIDPRLQVLLHYRDNEQDNRSAREQYNYEIADSNTITPAPRANTPFAFRHQNAGAELNYQISPARQTLSAAYQLSQQDRTYQSVSKTREHQLSLRYKLAFSEHWRLRASLSQSKRLGSEYMALSELPDAENPMMRDYYLANLDTRRAKLALHYSAKQFNLSLQSQMQKSDFDAELGVRDMKTYFHALNLATALTPRMTLDGGLDYYATRSLQAGRASIAAPIWTYELVDHDQQARLGFRYRPRHPGISYGLQWAWINSRFKSDSVLSGASSAFPDATLHRQTLQLGADYDIDMQSQLRVFYRYQKYQQDNWQRDALALDELSQVLSLGEISPVYDIGFFAISYRRSW